MTSDEIRALAFVACLIALSAVVRVLGAPDAAIVVAEPADLGALQAAGQEAADEEAQRRMPLGAEERLDPNRAPAAALDRLPGIGTATADRIATARDSAPFEVADDLLRVRGIGPATLEKIRPHLDLGPSRARPPSRRAPRAREGRGVQPAGASAGRGRTGASAGADPTGASAGADGTVDVNRASPEVLETLSGIGPALAARIIAHRDSAGPFRQPEDLLEVRGIGPATLERIRSRIRLR